MSPFLQAELLASSGQYPQAAARYLSLAQAGMALAQTRLAWMYEAGRGVPRSLEEAARRFEAAALAGEPEAQYALAVMYRTGQGKPKDMSLGMDWLRRAAAQRHPGAIAALASFEAMAAVEGADAP